VRASIKWPNDLWVQRKKIGGILIENSFFNNQISNVVMGIGININQTTFPENLLASSVKLETGVSWPVKPLALKFLQHWEKAFQLLQNKNFDALQTIYYQNLIGYQTIETYQSTQDTFQATIEGIESTGRLILKRTDGTKQAYDLKEVRLVP
jgi:BirA family biotin operon repressor/biotin-[acetyl-CoA-carboxylase] ligase